MKSLATDGIKNVMKYSGLKLDRYQIALLDKMMEKNMSCGEVIIERLFLDMRDAFTPLINKSTKAHDKYKQAVANNESQEVIAKLEKQYIACYRKDHRVYEMLCVIESMQYM